MQTGDVDDSDTFYPMDPHQETQFDTTIKVKEKRPRKSRKQPLFSLGDRRIGTDLSDKNTSMHLLQASSLSKSAKVELYAKLLKDLNEFINNVSTNWDQGEECRRFTIFGDCITCALWKDDSLISGVDIVKTVSAIYRLNHLGNYPIDRRKFEEGVISDLRNLKLGSDVFLEHASSPLLKFLFRINSVRTHKRQKIFKWNSVPFHRLYQDVLERERRYSPPVIPNNHKPAKLYDFPHQLSKKSSPTNSTDQGSPHSWGSPEHQSQSGFAIFLPSPIKPKPHDSNMDIMKLAMVADAVLTHSESKETLELPSIRERPNSPREENYPF